MTQIEFPITVSKVEWHADSPIRPGFRKKAVGKFVAIRPVSSICPEEKTYLGLYLGEVSVSPFVSYDQETQVLHFYDGLGNPAIFIFDLNRVVFGYESWWGVIENESDLEQFTDEDIQNIWYVKALKAMAEEHRIEQTKMESES